MLRVLTTTALILAAASAVAQNPQTAAPGDPTVTVAPPNATSPPPEKIAPPAETMSNNLARQRGTVSPPNVDPGMAISPPATGKATTPVIPPPGSPGGNQSVIPK